MDDRPGPSPAPASPASPAESQPVSRAAPWILVGCAAAVGLALLVPLLGVVLYFVFRSPAALAPGPSASSTVGPGTWHIRAAEGGVAGESAGAQLTVPPDVLRGDAEIVITPRDAGTHAVPGLRVVGRVWGIDIEKKEHFTFRKPVRVSLPVDPSLVAPGEPVWLSRWDDGEWQLVPGARLEGGRLVAETRDFCDCAVTQPDGSSGPEEKRHRLLHTEEWRGSVDIAIDGSRDVDYGIHSEHFTVARHATLTFRLRNRYRDSGGVLKWSSISKDPASPGDGDVSVEVADGGFDTDWDHDDTGNVYYRFSTTCKEGPCRPGAPFTLTVDPAKGTYSLSGSVGGMTVVHTDDFSEKKQWEEPMGVSFGVHDRPFELAKGAIRDTVKLTKKDFPADIGGPDPNEPVALERRSRVTVTLTPGAPLLARIKGPFVFRRADTVTLDGSKSLGEIAEYRWKVSFDGQEGPPAELTGPKVSFRALKTFKAVLEVTSKSGGKDSTSEDFEVERRTGPGWATKFRTARGSPLKSRMTATEGSTAGGLHLGLNECAKCPPGSNTGHQLHRDPKENVTWIDVGYELEELKDGGPFDGYVYVREQRLEIDRVERVNENLLSPDGEVVKLNQLNKKYGKAERLLAQVREHEEVHSKLVREALHALKSKGNDPARKVETVVRHSRKDAQDDADFFIRDAEGTLEESTSEKNVKDRMKNDKGFNDTIEVLFPRASFDKDKDELGAVRTLGPLYSLGDDLP